MPDSQIRERRPAAHEAPSRVIDPTNTVVTRREVIRNEDASAEMFFSDCHAVLVRGKSVRRHLYFNLPAAERAVRRARARGDRADMVLVQLVPVGGDRGGADVE